MSEWTYIIAAYAVAWVGLVAYAARLVMLNRRSQRRIRSAGGAT